MTQYREDILEARITGEEPDSPFKPLSDYPARNQEEAA